MRFAGLKGVALVGALAAVLLLPGTSGGGVILDPTREFGGQVEKDPTNYFGFNKQRQPRRVNQFSVGNGLFACRDGSAFRSDLSIRGRLRINNRGRFGGTVNDSFTVERGAVTVETQARIRGRFTRNRRARGTYRLNVSETGGAGRRCYTGLMRWKARKPSPPAPGAPPSRGF